MNTEYEYKVTIDGTDYSMDSLTSVSYEHPLFDSFSVGNACSAQLTVSYYKDDINPETMASVIAYCKSKNASSWTQLGVFYIDTRETATNGLTTLTCYDSMLKSDQIYLTEEVISDDWPKSQQTVVEDICTRMDLQLDTLTEINSSYTVDIPTDMTIREILNYIAAANGGNWIVTSENTLYLVPLFSSNKTYTLGKDVTSFSDLGKSEAISGIELLIDSTNMFVAGDYTGYVLSIDCPYGTQQMANDLLTKASGYTYQGYSAAQAVLPPEAELGDTVSVCDITGIIAKKTFKFTPGLTMDIEAPRELEVQHEYQYTSSAQRKIEKQITKTQSSITKTADEISFKIETVTENVNEAQKTADGAATEASKASKAATELKTSLNSIEMSFTSLSNKQEDTQEQVTTINKYIKFEDGDIILGGTDNPLTLEITREKISFKNNGSEIAYISNKKLYITEAAITLSEGQNNQLMLGNFYFIPRTNGNLSFKKVK